MPRSDIRATAVLAAILIQSVLVTPTFRGADGISALSRQIACALPQPVLVLSLHDADEVARGDLTVRGAAGSRTRLIALAARLSAECHRDTVAVCTHLHLAPVARMLAWRAAPVIHVLCGIESWVPLRPAERWALESGELIAISRYTEEQFKAANPGFGATTVTVVHPGVPPLAATPVATSSHPMALIVGRVAADEVYKGHDALVDIWPRVLARHPHAELCIVGDGTDRRRLEQRVADAGLAGPITFAGAVTDRRLERFYSECAFFVMPSRREGFGLVYLEAMRAGKACIAGRGAAAEIVQHNVTGLIVDPEDRDRIAAAVIQLFDDPLKCRSMGAAGRARYLSTFTDEQFRQRFTTVIRRRAVA
jgi:phosphatidylinositol alpha-1,6-mannosyltransferase